jgi:prolyl oligopeptidase
MIWPQGIVTDVVWKTEQKEADMRLVLAGLISVLGLAPGVVAADAERPSVSSASRPAAAYPPARRTDFAETFHGVEVRDPYRWMEDLRSPELAAWIEAQNQRSGPGLKADPFHAQALARMQALESLYPTQEPGREAGGRVFYRAVVDDRVQLMVSGPGAAAPRTLVDAAALGEGGMVRAFVPSPDGRRVAYIINRNGADWGELHIRDVDAGQAAPTVLPNVRFEGPMQWSADGEGLVYRRVAPPRDGRREAPAEDPALYLHRLGTPVAGDLRLFSLPDDRRDWGLSFDLPGDRLRLFASVERGPWHDGNLGGSRAQLHLIELDASGRPRDGAAPRVLTEPDAAYRILHVDAGRALVFTDKDAPRRRVAWMPLEDPSPAGWEPFIPEGEGVLTDAQWFGGRLVAHSIENVQSVVRVFDAQGKPAGEVALPGTGVVQGLYGGSDSPRVSLLHSGLLQPPVLLQHDLATGRTRVESEAAQAPDLSGFEVRQEWFTSKDGTRVPMFIVARKALERDGSHPTLLYGYGASGTSELPYFREDALAWVQMGGIYAIANLRGGGEFGRAWYEAATRERKQTTFDDLIAAAEHLVASGRTTPERLAISGASNGGMLVTAVLVQRPDLFGAVMADVPVTDAMRRHIAGNGAQQVDQWGTPGDADVFPALRAYSPLHNLAPGTCYPATLITTSHDDQRVPAWHAYKFAAALHAAQGCDAPILMLSRQSGGHGGGGLSGWLDNVAIQFAFAARQLGMPGAAGQDSSARD